MGTPGAAATDSTGSRDDGRPTAESVTAHRPALEYAFPLSLAQQRLWLLEQLAGSTVHNLPACFLIDGDLDADALARAVDFVVARHEPLRTSIRVVDGEPRQVVADELSLPVPTFDLRHLARGERTAEARRLAERQAREPFDLARAPLLRAALLRVDDEQHILVTTAHHAVSDGESQRVLLEDLVAAYSAYVAGREPALPPLDVQYADYAAWQREVLSRPVVDAHVREVRDLLAGAPALLGLLGDRTRPPIATYRGATAGFELGAALAPGLRRLAAEEQATTFMVLLAAYASVLSRYAGQHDVVVGAPIAGRLRPELERLIGFFANTLVVRIDISGEPSFRELVHRVRRATLSALAHQELPFERLVEELNPPRDLSYTPLYQALFTFQNEVAAVAGGGVVARPVWSDVDTGTARTDLTLGLMPEGARFCGVLEYATDLFDAGWAAGFVRHFERLLAGAVASPETSAASLDVLSDDERATVLAATPRAGSEPTPDQRLADAAARAPHAIAVAAGPRELTYRELDRRANALAHRLRAAGAGPEVVVGVAAERSLEVVLMLVAVAKAGAAYLPLDPAFPAARRAFMLEDAQARIVLASKAAYGPREVDVLVVDDAVAAPEAEGPPSPVDRENLAYVLYTSGSTGQPKGVMVSRANVASLVDAGARRFGFGPTDVWALAHPYSFDISVWELWGALANGGRAVVVPEAVVRDPAGFRQLLIDGGVTVLSLTPSAFSLLLAGEDVLDAATTRLGLIDLGGEVVEQALLDRWFSKNRPGRPEVLNAWGITETTVYTTFEPVRAPWPERELSVIGRPIGNSAVYVLDERLRPVPPSVCGELFVAGPGVSRGYIGRPGLTADRFVPNPLGDGTRVYRSGDLGRYRRDGRLDFVRRLDDQVKIRGFRIELAEIENVLGAHPAVREAAVVARTVGTGETALVAYAAASGPSPDDLRAYLKERLPEYMLPAAIVLLQALPKTPSGKLDRNALPVPSSARAGTMPLRAPHSAVETAIAAIWRDVLGVDEVGLDDNFFDCGGSSLTLARAQTRLREELGWELGMVDLFRFPTVSALARRLADERGQDELPPRRQR